MLGEGLLGEGLEATLDAIPDEPAAMSPQDHDPPEPTDDRARLIAYLSPAPIGTDELARATGLGVRIVQTTLLELELDGRIERHGSGAVSLVG